MQREKSIEVRVREEMLWHEIEAKKARERQVAAGAYGSLGGRGNQKTLPQNFAEGLKSETRDIVAERIKLSGFSYDKAKQVVEHADDLPLDTHQKVWYN